MPQGAHGCFVDYQGNIWVGGNGDGIVQKYNPAAAAAAGAAATYISKSALRVSATDRRLQQIRLALAAMLQPTTPVRPF